MIRYNANSPEIFGKKQYDVLRGFAILCVLCGVSYLLAIGFVVFIRPVYYLSKMHPTLCYTFFSLSLLTALYLLQLGLGLLKHKRFIYAHLRLTKIMAVLYLVFYISISIFSFYTLEKKITLFLLWFALDTGFTIFLIYNLYQTISQQVSSPITETSPVPNGDFAEPLYITCFEKFDPLFAYGRILLYYGGFYFVSGITYMVLAEETSYMSSLFLYSLGYMFILILCGIGLMRRSEFGRMINVIIHCLMAVYLTGQIIMYMVNYGQIPVTWNFLTFDNVVLGLILYTPVLWMYYFVIRVLTTPIVKYICLRRGYEIE